MQDLATVKITMTRGFMGYREVHGYGEVLFIF